MAKKCIPGVICIENFTLFILFVCVTLLIYVSWRLTNVSKPKPTTVLDVGGNMLTSRIPVVLNNVSAPHTLSIADPILDGIGLPNYNSYQEISTNNVLGNPYTPPYKSEYDIIPKTELVIDVRNTGANIRTQNTNIVAPSSSYQQKGILTNSMGSGTNLILPLMGRKIQRNRDKWQYYTMSNSGTLNTKLPIRVNGKSCTSEYGCNEIVTGDIVYVDGYNETFIATVYDNYLFSYSPF